MCLHKSNVPPGQAGRVAHAQLIPGGDPASRAPKCDCVGAVQLRAVEGRSARASFRVVKYGSLSSRVGCQVGGVRPTMTSARGGAREWSIRRGRPCRRVGGRTRAGQGGWVVGRGAPRDGAVGGRAGRHQESRTSAKRLLAQACTRSR